MSIKQEVHRDYKFTTLSSWDHYTEPVFVLHTNHGKFRFVLTSNASEADYCIVYHHSYTYSEHHCVKIPCTHEDCIQEQETLKNYKLIALNKQIKFLHIVYHDARDTLNKIIQMYPNDACVHKKAEKSVVYDMKTCLLILVKMFLADKRVSLVAETVTVPRSLIATMRYDISTLSKEIVKMTETLEMLQSRLDNIHYDD